MIVCRSASEIEKLARVNALVARVLRELVAVVKPGRILFEIEGVTPEVAKEAFTLAGHKLPIKCQYVAREHF